MRALREPYSSGTSPMRPSVHVSSLSFPLLRAGRAAAAAMGKLGVWQATETGTETGTLTE